jgi:hypothetical protein
LSAFYRQTPSTASRSVEQAGDRSSLAVREIASPIRSAIETTRMLVRVRRLGRLDRIGDHQFLELGGGDAATAPPDSTPWVM